MVKCFTIRTGKVVCEKGKNKKGAFAGSKGARKNFDRSKITKGRPSSPEPRAVRARKLRQMKKSGTAPKGVKKVLPKIKPKKKLVNKSKIKPPVGNVKQIKNIKSYIQSKLLPLETEIAKEEWLVRRNLAEQIQMRPNLKKFITSGSTRFKDMNAFLDGTAKLTLNITTGKGNSAKIMNRIIQEATETLEQIGYGNAVKTIYNKNPSKKEVDTAIKKVFEQRTTGEKYLRAKGMGGASYGFNLPFKFKRTGGAKPTGNIKNNKYIRPIILNGIPKNFSKETSKNMFSYIQNGAIGWFKNNRDTIRTDVRAGVKYFTIK